MDHVIPPMTDALGRHWRQPPLDNVLIDDKHALMTTDDFSCLPEYSSTIPSGVYPGKMWKAYLGEGVWALRWFGIVPGNDKVCSRNQREILLVGRK